MGESTGSFFNIIIMIVMVSILMALLTVFMPILTELPEGTEGEQEVTEAEVEKESIITEEELKQQEEEARQQEVLAKEKREADKKEKEEVKKKHRETMEKIASIFMKVSGAIVLLKVMVFVAVKIPYGEIREKRRAAKREKELMKNAGYVANKGMEYIQKFIEDNKLGEVLQGEYGNKVKEIQEKLEEIQKVYSGNIERHDIKMYSYEKTYKSILETLQLAKEKEVLMDEEVLDSVLEAVNYPYKDIVGEGIVKEVTESLGKEIGILKDLKRKDKR